MQKNNFLILSFILLFQFIYRTLNIVFTNWVFFYDEIIVNDISTQGIAGILNTTMSEPHPPGFYLFLSLLPDPFLHPIYFKIILSFISFLIWFGLFYKLKSQKLLNNYIFFYFLFILSTFSVFSINSISKQDILSLPLFLFVSTNFYLLVTRGDNTKLWMTNIFLTTASLFIGYLYYIANFFLILFSFFISKKNNRWISGLYIIHIVILLLYFNYFLRYQISFNINRFTWIHEYNNGFLSSLAEFLSVRNYLNVVSIFQLIIFFVFVSIAYMIFRRKSSSATKLILFCLIGLLLLFDNINLFVRARYSIFLHLVISFFFVYGLMESTLNKKTKIIIILTVFLLPTLLFYKQRNEYVYRMAESIVEINKKDTTYGLISQNVATSYVLHRGYSLSENIKPISKEMENYQYNGHIGFKILNSEGHEKKMSLIEIEKWLSDLDIGSYIYLSEEREKERLYDRERIVMKALDESCTEQQTIYEGKYIKIYEYNNCSFMLK